MHLLLDDIFIRNLSRSHASVAGAVFRALGTSDTACAAYNLIIYEASNAFSKNIMMPQQASDVPRQILCLGENKPDPNRLFSAT
jgi:hypothetical protein